ncbi:MAG: biotin--[acetyl-CoA-carboxylase] ligase [Acidiferrobacterales bacterium]|nr:biotin--[acetyl-CoA-carboxylase] ligase [Acidiferrobacterales bacterium]
MHDCAAILNSVQDMMPKSRASISRDTGLDQNLVDDAIQFMINIGVPLEADHEDMIRLGRMIIPLDIGYIREKNYDNLAIRPSHINLLDSVDSTNEYLLELSETRSIHAQVCIAEHMSHGRGSRSRKWVAGAFENIMLSVGWSIPGDIRIVTGLSLAVAVMTVHCLTRLTAQEFQVKWPNDVLLGNRKIAGILVEIRNSVAVVGVGVNCRLTASEAELIDQPAADLAEVCDITSRRSELAAELILELGQGLDLFFREGLAPFKDEWMHLHANQGRIMRAQGDVAVTGVAVGIDDSGALLVKPNDSMAVPIYAGDVRPVD